MNSARGTGDQLQPTTAEVPFDFPAPTATQPAHFLLDIADTRLPELERHRTISGTPPGFHAPANGTVAVKAGDGGSLISAGAAGTSA